MTIQELALYSPLVIVALAGLKMLFQLSKVLNKVEGLGERMGKMERLSIEIGKVRLAVSNLATLTEERHTTTTNRIEKLESDGNS